MEWPRSGAGMVVWCQRPFEVSDCRRGGERFRLEGRFVHESNREASGDQKGKGKNACREECQGTAKTSNGEEGRNQENCGEEDTCEARAEQSGSSCTSQRKRPGARRGLMVSGMTGYEQGLSVLPESVHRNATPCTDSRHAEPKKLDPRRAGHLSG